MTRPGIDDIAQLLPALADDTAVPDLDDDRDDERDDENEIPVGESDETTEAPEEFELAEDDAEPGATDEGDGSTSAAE